MQTVDLTLEMRVRLCYAMHTIQNWRAWKENNIDNEGTDNYYP